MRMHGGSDGRIHIRRVEKLQVPDIETFPSPDYVHNAITLIFEELKGIKRVIADRTKAVDEYIPGGATNSENSVEVQPIFEYAPERIESIFYWGPPAATGTIQLGDMTFAIVVPARGWDVIAPVGFLLNRSDRRIITLGTAGNMGLRLMGYADERY